MFVSEIDDPSFDAVFVGSGFATSFFLHRFLKSAPKTYRVLILERGRLNTLAWQRETQQNSDIPEDGVLDLQGAFNAQWRFTMGVGGGSNCWTGDTPRPIPNDLSMQTTYGVGIDWPVSYEELEPFMAEAEDIMQVSGPEDGGPQARSTPYPQPPHRFSAPDRVLKAAQPSLHFAAPTARARIATETRPACCGTTNCSFCPVGARFTLLKDMASLFEDPRVQLLTEAEALSLELSGGRAVGMNLRHGGREKRVSADLFALGANSFFNPFLLLKSGIQHAALGKRLHHYGIQRAHVYLDGLDGFGGSSLMTGHNFALRDGTFRRDTGGCLLVTLNRGLLRTEPRRWREVLNLDLKIEDLPLETNRVEVSKDDPSKPIAIFEDFGPYFYKGLERAKEKLPSVLKALPIERIDFDGHIGKTAYHNQGTVLMGNDPAASVVDRHLLHHDIRNLLVLGASAFPTGPVANPTLTLCALSLWSARKLTASQA